MQFCWVTIHVRDFEASFRFYTQALGLPVAVHSAHGDTELAMLGEKGQPLIELLHQGGETQQEHTGAVTVGVRVDDLDQAVQKLGELGIPIIRGPFAPTPHIRFSFVRDPDGTEIQLVQEL